MTTITAAGRLLRKRVVALVEVVLFELGDFLSWLDRRLLDLALWVQGRRMRR